MKLDKQRGAFILCAILFVAALIGSALFSDNDTGEFKDTESSIIISEILSSNRSYPAPDGRLLDFVEVRNISDAAVDISGFMLSDDAVSIGYTFPEGTILPPDGYIVCWCDSDDESGTCAVFGISRNGGDCIYLYNTANVIIDQKAVPHMNANIPLVRLDNGEWAVGTQASPGFANTDEGFAAYLHAMGGDDTKVVISEVMLSNGCTATGTDGRFTDWVEIKNMGEKDAHLEGAYISDDPLNPMKWRIESLSLRPGESGIIRCAGNSAIDGEADFSLSSGGCTVVLTGIMGNTLSTLDCPSVPRDSSYALQPGGAYAVTDCATPGFENDRTGYTDYLHAMGTEDYSIVISEVMTSNRSSVLSANGELCDWVEITNAGSVNAVLDGAYLSDDMEERGKWRIDKLTLAAGESAVIRCAGDKAAEGEADFSLPAEGCTVMFSGSAGNLISTVSVPRLDRDRSWSLQENGEYIMTDLVSPGFENTSEGCIAYRNTLSPIGALAINEIMPANNRLLMQSDGDYYDWVELVNVSKSTINLSDYCLSDSADDPYFFNLPDRSLAPGQTVIIICSGDSSIPGSYIHAPFTLSREESWFYVSEKNGSFSDYMRIYDVPTYGSVGRPSGGNGTCYFTTPTPGSANGSGVSLIAPAPTIVTADGVFNGIGSINVEIEGEGEIRYTLDGSSPTAASPLYTGPVAISSTTVVRAAGFAPGHMRSDVVTAAYIINENHSLPVLSLTAEPGDLFGSAGIYSQSRRGVEVPCNLKLFENGDGFSIDGGVKMYGHTGLLNPKKSFKVNFGGRYGEKVLYYPVYGEDGPEIYDALVIRSGQDYPYSIFRDELFTSLCLDMGDNVLAQRDKFCILYINGNYYGIFCLKEAFTEMFYAQNKGVNVDSVTMAQAPLSPGHELFDIIAYCRNNDLSQPQHYEYIEQRVDLDSLIDWMIIQGYSCNGDVQQNLRYFKSSETGNKWQLAYYDLDWAFYFHNPFNHVLDSSIQLLQHESMTIALMENGNFRDKFLKRLGEMKDTVLSDENVLARMSYYEDLLDSEVYRERERWQSSYAGWQASVRTIRGFIENHDHWGDIEAKMRSLIGLTDYEAERYLGR